MTDDSVTVLTFFFFLIVKQFPQTFWEQSQDFGFRDFGINFVTDFHFHSGNLGGSQTLWTVFASY